MRRTSDPAITIKRVPFKLSNKRAGLKVLFKRSTYHVKAK